MYKDNTNWQNALEQQTQNHIHSLVSNPFSLARLMVFFALIRTSRSIRMYEKNYLFSLQPHPEMRIVFCVCFAQKMLLWRRQLIWKPTQFIYYIHTQVMWYCLLRCLLQCIYNFICSTSSSPIHIKTHHTHTHKNTSISIIFILFIFHAKMHTKQCEL